MPRPLSAPSQHRELTRIGSRARNLERRAGVSPALGGGSLDVLQLWSRSGDPNKTIAAAAVGGTRQITLPFDHMASTSTFWFDLQLAFATVTTPPIDTVELNPGWYHVDLWTSFQDHGFVSWLAVALALWRTNSGLSPEPQSTWQQVRQIDGTIVSGLGFDSNTGQWNLEGTLYVDAAASNLGQVFATVTHQSSAHSVTVIPNRTLTITKLA